MQPSEREIEIRLTHDEALVLSHWIYQMQRSGTRFADSTIWMPLWAIGGALESVLPEIFAADYERRLADARSRLAAEMGDAAERLSTGKDG